MSRTTISINKNGDDIGAPGRRRTIVHFERRQDNPKQSATAAASRLHTPGRKKAIQRLGGVLVLCISPADMLAPYPSSSVSRPNCPPLPLAGAAAATTAKPPPPNLSLPSLSAVLWPLSPPIHLPLPPPTPLLATTAWSPPRLPASLELRRTCQRSASLWSPEGSRLSRTVPWNKSGSCGGQKDGRKGRPIEAKQRSSPEVNSWRMARIQCARFRLQQNPCFLLFNKHDAVYVSTAHHHKRKS